MAAIDDSSDGSVENVVLEEWWGYERFSVAFSVAVAFTDPSSLTMVA